MKAAPPANRPRAAIMGTGRWGRNVVRAFEKIAGAQLAWIVDPDPAARAMAAAIAPRAKPVSHISEAIDDVEIVAVCTPAREHFEHVLPLLETGKSVLVEKPIAMNLPDAQLLARAKAPSSTLMVGHQLLYHPAFVALAGQLSKGALGRLCAIRTDRAGPVDRVRETGALWSYGPHDVAMVLALTGEEPSEVQASAVSTAGGGDGAERIDIVLGFSTGVRAEIHLSSIHDRRLRRLIAVCEGGTLVFDDAKPEGKLVFFDGTAHGIPGIEIPVSDEEPLTRECAHFLACLREGKEPVTGMDHAVRVTRVLDTAATCLTSPAVKPAFSVC